jgi:hypothetical protein
MIEIGLIFPLWKSGANLHEIQTILEQIPAIPEEVGFGPPLSTKTPLRTVDPANPAP